MATPEPPYGVEAPPPRYVALPGNGGAGTPATSSPASALHPAAASASGAAVAAAYHRSIRRRRRRLSCRRWLCRLLLLAVLLLLALSRYVHFAVGPKLPIFTVDSLAVAVLDVHPASDTVLADVTLNVRAENANRRLGIRHGGGGSAEVAYRGATLCSGLVPAFYQPERDATVVAVRMSGRSAAAPGARAALLEGKRGAGIPLDVRVRMPVGVRVGGGLEIGHVVTVSVAGVVVVDGLAPGRTAAVRSAQYTVATEFL